MSRWDGVFRCEKLGVEDCVVWWDAVGAMGTLVAIVTTAILGYVTYRLGKTANSASQLAVRLAGEEAIRQAARDKKERILLLVQITGEVTTNRGRILELHEHLAEPDSQARFVENSAYRADFMERMSRVSFPLVERLADRYHYLDGKTGPTLIRAVGMFATMQGSYLILLDEQPEGELRSAHALLFTMLPIIADDLEVVRLACSDAIRESGIDDARIARLALQVSGAEEE